MTRFCHFFGIVFVSKQNGKSNCDYQGISCKTQPDTVPIPYAIVGEKGINNLSADDSAKKSTKSIGHHYEQSLRTGTNPMPLCRPNALS